MPVVLLEEISMKHILPPLDDVKNVVPPCNKSGQWIESDNMLLGYLAESINVAALDRQAEELISIPDVWARPAVVTNALYDSNHPTHKIIQGEWRGLLAVFALMPYHKQVLETKIINLSTLKNNPFQINADSKKSSNFAKVLHTITPSLKIARDQTWDEIAIIKLNKKPIGLVTPSTIVCPGRHYANYIDHTISWFQGGKLIDPCLAKNITPEEFSVLIYYLDKLKEGLTSKTVASTDDVVAGIMGAIDSFRRDCANELSKENTESIDFQGFIKVTANLNLPNQPVYPLLANIYKGDSAGKNSFSTCMSVRSELSDTFKGCILYDEEMSNRWGLPASSIILWNTVTLDKAVTTKKRKTEIQKEINEAGYLFIDVEDLFTPKFSIVQASLNILEHPNDLDEQYLYPLNPIALLLLEPDALSRDIKIVKSGESYTITVNVTLRSHKGTEKKYLITKEYGKNDVIRKDQPTVNTVWPNFNNPDWKTYFLYGAASLQQGLLVRNTFDILSTKEKIQNLELRDQINAIEDFKGKSIELSERLGIEESTYVTELFLMKFPPEAIFYDVPKDSSTTKFVPSIQRIPAGLIIMPTVKKVIQSNSEMKIGIDFGTTNTSAYFQIDSAAPKNFIFQDRIHSPFEKTKDVQWNDVIDKTLIEFIPTKDVPVPFLSLLRDRLSETDPLKDPLLPVWSNYIYFVNNILSSLDDIIDPHDRPIHGNLKWSDSPADIIRVEVFMAQVALQSLSEAYARGIKASNISWSYSYPEAFTPKNLRSYKKLFKKSLNKAISPLNIQEEDVTPVYKSESLASALYFANQTDKSFEQSAVTIDIGGHTSDISIFQERKLLWRSSLQLAGRHIFIDFLNENIEIIKELGLFSVPIENAFKKIEKIIEMDDRDSLRNAIEMIVNSKEFDDTFRAHFDTTLSRDVTGKRLRVVSELAFSGILFYIAKVVIHLKSKNLFDTTKDTFSICIGGKTSLLYKTIFNDTEDLDGLKDLFINASNGLIEKDSVSFVYTDKPKHEVSHGLLVEARGMANLTIDSPEQNFDTPLGENILVDGQEVSSTDFVENLNPNKKWRIKNITNIKAFCDLLRDNNNILLNLETSTEKNILASIEAKLIEAQEANLQYIKDGIDPNSEDLRGESTTTEPPFIVGIRNILSRINNSEIDVENHQR